MLKALGFGMAAGMAIPIAGLSGLASIGLLFVMLISERNRSPDIYLYLSLSVILLVAALWLLRHLQKRAQALVASINQREGLLLNGGNLLGYPSPMFIVFDSHSQKLAVCNAATGAYQVQDIGWVTRWYMTWKEVESMEITANGRAVNPTGIVAPAFENNVRLKDFALVLEVRDPQQPIMRFAMSRRAAEDWCARLNAQFG